MSKPVSKKAEPTTVALPDLDTLSWEAIDEISEWTGIDITGRSGPISVGRAAAALEVWARRKQGEMVTLEEVYGKSGPARIALAAVPTTPTGRNS